MKLCIRALYCALWLPVAAFAGVDKVYEPYVELNELEIETRGIHQFGDEDSHEVKFGAGYGVSAKWFFEAYLVAEKEPGEDAEVEELEIESRFQLTEQGQYWADFGALVELEKVLEDDVWELKAGPIIQKEFTNKWVGTLNILFEKQFGDDKTEDELETLAAARVKYRMSPFLQPAAEFYTDEHTKALGPVLLGETRWGKTPMKWVIGVLAGLNDDTADTILRWELEWEY